jgi:ABC-type phosphate transport system substrate-binding protein
MSPDTSYPEGSALKGQIVNRHRRGSAWQLAFQVSTIIGIIALIALLYNITNQAFGLVAIQNKVEPSSLVLAREEERLLSAVNTITSEDDNELVAGIASDANAIGFFGYAYYQQNSDQLKLLTVDGITPTAENVANETYPLVRPLYLYTTADVLAQNQAANVFLNYYLTHVNEEIADVGYFAAADAQLSAARTAWITASGLGLQPGQWAAINPEGIGGQLSVVGSSTLFPVNERIADRLATAGFAATVNLESVGSTAGLRAFCEEGTADIAAASRSITSAEFEACRENGRLPIEIQIGTDALAIVTSPENSFTTNVTPQELRTLFDTATTWADANEAWPASPVARYIPGADSGTLDFFAATVFPIDLADLPKDTLVELLAANISVGLGRRLEREQRFYDDRLVFDDPDLFAAACASDEPAAGCTMPARDQENVYELLLQEVVAPDVVSAWSLMDSLFARDEVETFVATEYPNAELTFRSWLTLDFITSPQSSTPEFAGVRTAIMGSLWVVAITVLVLLPDRRGRGHLPGRVRLAFVHQPHHPDQHQQPGRSAFDHLRDAGAGHFCTDAGTTHQRGTLWRGGWDNGQRPYHPLRRSHPGAAHSARHHHCRPGSHSRRTPITAAGGHGARGRPNGKPSGLTCCPAPCQASSPAPSWPSHAPLARRPRWWWSGPLRLSLSIPTAPSLNSPPCPFKFTSGPPARRPNSATLPPPPSWCCWCCCSA